MKIQLALDRLTKDEYFHIVRETMDFIDWIEIGTGIIKEYGMSIVKEMKSLYPDKMIVADMKTCDAGKHEAEQAFKAGADVMTVMGFANNHTILDALEVAQSYKKQVMIDLLEIKEKGRVEELNRLGADFFCLHIGKDSQLQGESVKEGQMKLVSGLELVHIAVAGGVNEDSVGGFLNKGIQVAIVGSAITKSENPSETAKRIREAFQI
ncbi:3-hexulose-6-phosphate synthase [Planococcus halotolerans]|uniref:3-hexulose-6-phosphate synthase n=1 Tax=Planococcus halotolerans TaxID=2233542 RepID=UPI0010923AB8|nr:3-hexulose-6-phosphate synthase [Planococcus halotolerans]QHJ70105.1 Fe-S cluster assembly protein HesB [Planococcus halotolerans]